MKKRKCLHPRRMVNIMRDFLFEASDLEYEATYPPADVTFEDFWNDHSLMISEMWKCDCKVKHTGRFEAHVGDFQEEDDSVFVIGYSMEEIETKVSDYFTDNFRSRFPVAKGFSNVTLALLHELGHFETCYDCDEQYPDWNRSEARKELHKKYKPTNDLYNANQEYFTWPDERLATEWAANWLTDANNRKLAKAFEIKFASCFK